ncbi:MAG: acyl-CoA dehydrogenase family protein [Gemmiger formicilis]|uniref:acyl-CoA dehydrogenase family protein n=1 Tax=Gemmiger formicilis TaxID=745368 RepID=UPI003A137517
MMGIYFPKSVGGAGGDVLSYVMAVEELSKVCGTTGVILSAHTSLCAAPIYENGTPEQKASTCPSCAAAVGRRVRPDRARCRYRRSGPADLRR